MKHFTAIFVATLFPMIASAAGVLNVDVSGIGSDGVIAPTNALCKATPDGKSGPGDNTRPDISWSGAPTGTKSYAVFMHDPDVPADFSDAGKEGKTIDKNAARQDFYHWGVVNIPATTTKIPGGSATNPPEVGQQISNSLGKYVSIPGQFGGPCPPWNDARVHHYHFVVLALDVPKLDLPVGGSASDVLHAADGHILAQGEKMGTYTLNPKLAHTN